jgi:hypothetical protein
VRLEMTLLLRHLGFTTLAERWGIEALDWARRARFRRGEVLAHLYLGDIYLDLGQAEMALAYLQPALVITNDSAPEGDLVVDCYRRLAEAFLACDKLTLCERALVKGFEKATVTNDEVERIGLLRVQGQLAALRDQSTPSQRSFEEARRLSAEEGFATSSP